MCYVLFSGRMDMLSLKKYEEVQHIMQLGYEYAKQLHHEGHFDHFEVGTLQWGTGPFPAWREVLVQALSIQRDIAV